MIVSALVVTSERRTESLAEELKTDARLEVGVPEEAFLPIVTTTDSLKSSRQLYEELRSRAGVVDVQLVSWTDEGAIGDVPVATESEWTKEKR